MASLFALGIMSIAWMALVTGLIAAEKMLPWGRVATYGTAGILLAPAFCSSPFPNRSAGEPNDPGDRGPPAKTM